MPINTHAIVALSIQLVDICHLLFWALPVSRRSPFKRHRFPPEIILLAVRWYCRYALSYHDVRDMLSERGIEVDGSTIYR